MITFLGTQRIWKCSMHSYIPTFTAAFFTIPKSWNQANAHSKKAGFKKIMDYTINVLLLSCLKRWNTVFWNKMDGSWGNYAKWDKSKWERATRWFHSQRI